MHWLYLITLTGDLGIEASENFKILKLILSYIIEERKKYFKNIKLSFVLSKLFPELYNFTCVDV